MAEENQQALGTKIIPRVIQDEMKQSYLDYSMSVIVGRALPDARDGLKPVHRRVLFTMWEGGLLHNSPFKKSANVVGNCMAKFHPHGDSAIYDTLVRLAQSFSMRYPLVDGQGNFGSIDGDPPAAMRYCVTGDSLILTDKGILPIKDVANKEDSRIIKILSYDGKTNSASKFFNSGKHKVIRLKTKLGYEIIGSYNHPLMCWTFKKSHPQIEWKLLENIDKKDIVLISRNHGLFSKNPLNLEEYHPKKGFKKNIKLPERMTDDLAFLLGALVSEGSFHNNQILFNNQDIGYYNKVKSAILSLFKGIKPYERKIKGGCIELSIYNQKAVIFLKNIGLNQAKSDKKVIPFSVLSSTKDNIKNFLVGLFEGDGSVSYKVDKRHEGKSMELTYNSKSINLIKQLKIILLNFGIVTTNPYKDKRNDCYKLLISGCNSIKIFKNEIGFFSKRKNTILLNIDYINGSRMSKTDSIPYISEYLRKKYKAGFIAKNNFDRYNNLEKNYRDLIKIIDYKDRQFVDFILTQKFLFDEVLEIEKLGIEEVVYSIKVNSSCNSFVANGFINHNTECRLTRLAEEMLEDIDKKTVRFAPNFDSSATEPAVLPSKLPNLLINGSSGIAVGMATNIPPHNIGEVIEAVISQIDAPDISLEEIMSIVQGPDFPTGAIVCGRKGIRDAYSTGRGKLLVRARTKIEDDKKDKNKSAIIVNEIPFMVNKSELLEEIAGLVSNKKIVGISDLRDESDRHGIRIVIELKRDTDSGVVLNQLFQHTRMQTTFGIIMLALVNNEPKVLNIKQLIHYYITHRKEVVRRKTLFELNKAQIKAHVLEGLMTALANISGIIKLIKESKSVEAAKHALSAGFNLTGEQAVAILEMRLQRLTSLEQEKIKQEHNGLLKLIEELESVLSSPQKILDAIKTELKGIRERYSDARRTQISDSEDTELETEDLIKEQDMAITITNSGYIKRLPLQAYKLQHRGGRGVIAAATKDEDIAKDIFIASTHSYILFFTNMGRVYWLKVYGIPESGRQARGKAIVNLLELGDGEGVTASVPVRNFDSGHYLIMSTKKGTVKKTGLMAYSNPRKNGIAAITLEEKDELINVELTDGKQQIILATKNGLAVRFEEQEVRATGRSAQGVRGINLKENDEVIGMVVASNASDRKTLLSITENGYGKRTPISDYRLISRGGSGVINIQCSERNGKVVSICDVTDDDDVIFISKSGIVIRVPASDVSVIGRSTQGVRIMKLKESDKVVGAVKAPREGNGHQVINDG